MQGPRPRCGGVDPVARCGELVSCGCGGILRDATAPYTRIRSIGDGPEPAPVGARRQRRHRRSAHLVDA